MEIDPHTVAREALAVRDRYARRDAQRSSIRYSPLNPVVYLSSQERERALIRLIHLAGLTPLANKQVLEIGCGSGGNLLQLIKLGFHPGNLVANELLEERIALASTLLPAAVDVIPGDASTLSFAEGAFDVILQSTVFSSLLDEEFQALLAARMWQWVKPGGGIIWYDFTFNNPSNPDVRGVPLRRVHALFPDADIRAWRLTLAPPISRVVTRIHPSLYQIFNWLPFLRTHLLCWIAKPVTPV